MMPLPAFHSLCSILTPRVRERGYFYVFLCFVFYALISFLAAEQVEQRLFVAMMTFGPPPPSVSEVTAAPMTHFRSPSFPTARDKIRKGGVGCFGNGICR